jgi:hypothetical protein
MLFIGIYFTFLRIHTYIRTYTYTYDIYIYIYIYIMYHIYIYIYYVFSPYQYPSVKSSFALLLMYLRFYAR